MQVEGTHVLVDGLGLLMPVSDKREEVGFVVAQFLWINRCDPMLHRNGWQKKFLVHFVLERNHICSGDGHTLSTRTATNCPGVGVGHIKDSVHD